jgi:hypothetical protein
MRNICRLACLFLAFAIGNSSVASAQQSWADGLVQPGRLEFGVIARGSAAARSVTLTNSTGAPLHIQGVSTACRCAEAQNPSKTLLQPGEKATIEVRMNTTNFEKQRDTTLSIFIDAPQSAEVRVPISAYIRTDVVFDPGKVDLERVSYGTEVNRRVTINYAGRPEWQIRELKVTNPDLTAEFKEIKREQAPADGINVIYQLQVKLSAKAKVGRIAEYITIVTDDSRNPYVPLLVQGEVRSDITISNPSITLQSVKVGQSKKTRLVVVGEKPFVVERIDAGDLKNDLRANLSDKADKQHRVELEFTAPDRPGRFTQKVQLFVKNRAEPIEFVVSGTIIP